MVALERWRESFAEVQSLDLNKFLTKLEAMYTELDMRFESIERMLSGKPSMHTPQTVTLEIDSAVANTLTHFQKAAVTVFIIQVNGLEALSRPLFYSVRDIKGYGRPPSSPVAMEARAGNFSIDPDRLQSALKTMATLWAAFLIWFYIDPPGHSSFVEFATIIAMGSAMVSLSPVTLFTPFIVLTLAAGALYIFVMPHLSGFTQLSLMLFGGIFTIYYVFWQPRQALSKSIGAAMLLNVIGVQNQQTYDFAGFANTVIMIAVACGIAILIWYVPPSPRPEKVFLRLLARFYKHSEFMMLRMALDRKQGTGLIERWKWVFYQNDLSELPQKLRALSGQIDPRLFPGATSEEVQALVNSVQALAMQLKDLADMGKYSQATLLVQELLDDVRSWRMAIQKLFQRWSEDPAAESDEELQNQLAAKLKKVENRINQTLSQTEEGELRESDYQNFYRLIGSYRSMSESVVEHAKLTGSFDWQELKEERF